MEDDDNVQVPQPLPRQANPGFVPRRLMDIILMIQHIFPAHHDRYYNVDCFAGEMAISRAFRTRGLPSIALDICKDWRDDP